MVEHSGRVRNEKCMSNVYVSFWPRKVKWNVWCEIRNFLAEMLAESLWEHSNYNEICIEFCYRTGRLTKGWGDGKDKGEGEKGKYVWHACVRHLTEKCCFHNTDDFLAIFDWRTRDATRKVPSTSNIPGLDIHRSLQWIVGNRRLKLYYCSGRHEVHRLSFRRVLCGCDWLTSVQCTLCYIFREQNPLTSLNIRKLALLLFSAKKRIHATDSMLPNFTCCDEYGNKNNRTQFIVHEATAIAVECTGCNLHLVESLNVYCHEDNDCTATRKHSRFSQSHGVAQTSEYFINC